MYGQLDAFWENLSRCKSQSAQMLCIDFPSFLENIAIQSHQILFRSYIKVNIRICRWVPSRKKWSVSHDSLNFRKANLRRDEFPFRWQCQTIFEEYWMQAKERFLRHVPSNAKRFDWHLEPYNALRSKDKRNSGCNSLALIFHRVQEKRAGVHKDTNWDGLWGGLVESDLVEFKILFQERITRVLPVIDLLTYLL